ncbi:MAG TPA: DUF6798 domain-containing protein [Flavitalea sp.]|nr:DUF6798 domain-containing protein [Flavitalea sp.]
MIKTNRNLTLDILAAVILYAAVIVYQGYQYGQSDQSQILPVLFAQDHPGTYSNDQYVNAYLHSGVDERTIFHFILRYSGYDIPWLIFVWHTLFSMALIIAWIWIARLFISNKALQFASIGCILIIGFHTSVGSNEIYYNQFIPSLPAKAISSWAIYFWLKNKYASWSALLILSSLLQPLVGLQVFILTTLPQLIVYLHNPRKEKLPLVAMLLFLIVISPWILLLAFHNGGRNAPSVFMDIMEFRLSHHFFASYFGFFNLLIFCVLSIFCIFFYKGKLKWFALVVIAGCCVYEIGVEIFRMPFFLYTQWWKTTIWLEAFGIIAIISFLESGFFIKEKLKRFAIVVPVIILFAVCIYRLTGLFGNLPTYMSPLTRKMKDDVDISLLAKKLTSEGAVFILPPDLTAFRWYSKRSTYVDHKALFHQEEFLNEWYKRIQTVYLYNLTEKRNGIPFDKKALQILNNPDPGVMNKWKTLGITHIISQNPYLEGVELLGQNASYSIYKL